MRVTLARNNGKGGVARYVFTDPYKASNNFDFDSGFKVVECKELYAIGGGEYRKENCWYCPLEKQCLCENRRYQENDEGEVITVKTY